MRLSKGVFLTLLLIILVFACVNPACANSEYDSAPLTASLNDMNAQELAAEMRYALLLKQQGKFYPPERYVDLGRALAKRQVDDMKNYQQQLKQDADEAKQLEDLKNKAIDKIAKKLNEKYDEHKDEINKQAEELVKEQVGEESWNKAKELYENGSEFYEKKLSGYVEDANKVYELYNKYQETKEKNPYAPEAANNLNGFLAASGDVLKEIGGKLGDSPTPLKIVGEVIKAYGEATSLGGAMETAAMNEQHPNGYINPMAGSIFKDGLTALGQTTVTDISSIMSSNKNITVLQLNDPPHQGEYAAFDEKGKLIEVVPGRDTLTQGEYNKVEQLLMAWNVGKKDGWPNLTTEQLVKLAAGEKVDVTLSSRLLGLWNTKQGYTADDILKKANELMAGTEYDTLIQQIDQDVNGRSGLFGRVADLFTRSGRLSDIRGAFSDYLDAIRGIDDSWVEKSNIELLGDFRDLVKSLHDKGKSWKEIRRALKDFKAKSEQIKNDKGNDQDQALNQLKQMLGIKIKVQKPGAKSAHWVTKNSDEFSGNKDTGFSKVGDVPRQLPDPFALNIPVLKPNIYLYPLYDTYINVAFLHPGNVTESIPEYSQEHGWSVLAQPSGKIDGTLDYLFYEASVNKLNFQTEEGYYLPPERRVAVLKGILDSYGFNQKERQDFLGFWDSKLEKGQGYYVYPQFTICIDEAMPINIAPRPKSIYRVWFYFVRDNTQKSIIPPEKIEYIKHDGYTVVEWGGMVE
ncbi:MAG: hypothetical protein ABSC17_02225 [Thermacetogeniaceae bacterium]